MSFAPKPLLEVRGYLKRHIGLSDAALGIVGDRNHSYGYHLGHDRLPRNDYSARHARDIDGLTDAASALDIGNFAEIEALTVYLVHEARDGLLPDMREVIGPWSDHRAYRWDSMQGWEARRRARNDSHEEHIHLSYWRDSQRRSKLAPFREFFEGGQTAAPPPRLLNWTETIVETLPLVRKGDKGPDVRTVQGLCHARGERRSPIDGDFGPKTYADVRAFQHDKHIGVDGIVGPQTWPKLLGR